MTELVKKVLLELEVHYDFSTRRWTPDDFEYATDIINATEKVFKKLYTNDVSKSLLKKYMQHVENCEGVNFVSDIGASWSGIDFNKEEKDLLERLDEEIQEINER